MAHSGSVGLSGLIGQRFMHIAAEHMRTLMEEAPSQYKSVTPVVETVADAGIHRRSLA
jgi:RNA-splicing ligase RtcB